VSVLKVEQFLTNCTSGMCYVIICPVGCDEHVINKLSKALNMPHNLKITFPPANLRILFLGCQIRYWRYKCRNNKKKI